MDWKRKLSSRKFWIAIAAMLSSIGTTIAGLNSECTGVVIAGIVCTALSAAAYAVAEAIADAAHTNMDYAMLEPPGEEDD